VIRCETARSPETVDDDDTAPCLSLSLDIVSPSPLSPRAARRSGSCLRGRPPDGSRTSGSFVRGGRGRWRAQPPASPPTGALGRPSASSPQQTQSVEEERAAGRGGRALGAGGMTVFCGFSSLAHLKRVADQAPRNPLTGTPAPEGLKEI
jgi:hypothetical protein